MIVILVAVIVFLVLLVGFLFNRYKTQGSILRKRFEEDKVTALEAQRKILEDSFKYSRKVGLQRQRGIITGREIEKLLPWMEPWLERYNIGDLVLVKDLADFIVFVGRTQGKVERVVLQDLKYNTSVLSPIQESLKECVEKGLVVWETWRLNSNGRLYMVEEEKLFKKTQQLLKEGKSMEEIYGEPKEG